MKNKKTNELISNSKSTSNSKTIKEKFNTLDRIIAISTLIIAITSLIVAFVAMCSSNKLAINNSALIFSYENIDIEIPTIKEGIEFEVSSEDVKRGGAKINIDVKVMSGQISSLYLIQKHNGEYLFKLLNDGVIQDKSSGIESYKLKLYFDMEEEGESSGVPIGIEQLYMLSEDINGQVNIDTIQIIGPIIQETENGNVNIYISDLEYCFRYLKNNKLITLHGNDDIDEEWVNYTNSYSEYLKKTNIEEIENDIAAIREIYSRYKY